MDSNHTTATGPAFLSYIPTFIGIDGFGLPLTVGNRTFDRFHMIVFSDGAKVNFARSKHKTISNEEGRISQYSSEEWTGGIFNDALISSWENLKPL